MEGSLPRRSENDEIKSNMAAVAPSRATTTWANLDPGERTWDEHGNRQEGSSSSGEEDDEEEEQIGNSANNETAAEV